MKDELVTAYPLSWPAGWPRCQEPKWSQFSTTIARARDGVMRELRLLGATDVVISSNAVLLRNGEISGRQPRIDDTGVAVYFTLHGEQKCIPCDKWRLIEENLRAIELTVEALRGLERWGAKEIVSAAFRGFQALPATAGGAGWWSVLGVSPAASREEIDAAYRSLVKQHHPDVGGDADEFHRIAEAYRQATA